MLPLARMRRQQKAKQEVSWIPCEDVVIVDCVSLCISYLVISLCYEVF
jgi:hypothetical protein